MNRVKKYLIEGSFFYHVNNVIKKGFMFLRKRLDDAIALVMRKAVYSKGKIQQNKVFFMTYDNAYTCNPKYIAEELLKRNKGIDLVWTIPPTEKEPTSVFPDGIRLVRRGTVEMFEEQATAKVWIDNALNCVWFDMPKKAGQVYINTWHGSMGIKKLSGDRLWKFRASKCNKLTDYCITNSTFEEDIFRREFWPDVEFKQFGHPRNDMFFDPAECEKMRLKVLRFYGLSKETRIILHAPTFRDDGSSQYLNLDLEAVRAAAIRKYGGKWVVLSRLHFKDRTRLATSPYSKNIKDGGRYPDMQELMAAADIGITDYSSWAYDYILLKRPMILYCPDFSKYAGGRGFYYPLETTPFPIAKTGKEVVSAIEAFDDTKYLADIEAFLADKGCYEEGKAAARTADLIEEILFGAAKE